MAEFDIVAAAQTQRPQLPADWQPDVQRLLSHIVPLLSAEKRHTFRELVKDLRAKRDAREIPSLSAALMEQAPQVVGADLWQQCIDRQREEAVRQAAAAGAPAAAVRQAAAGAPAPPPREANVMTGDALDEIQNLAPRGGKSLKTAVSLKRKALEERDAARAEAKRAEAGKGVAVLSTVSECHKRIDQLERRLTRVSDFCIELGAEPDAVNELRYGPI